MISRRDVLRLGGTTIAGLAGCLYTSGRREESPPPTTGPPDTPTVAPPATQTGTTARTPTAMPTHDCPPPETPSGGASLAVRNRLDEPRRGSVSIERTDGGVIYEETFDLAAGEGTFEDDVVTESGDFEIELVVATEATERWSVSLPDENEMPLGAYTLTVYIDEQIDLHLLHGDPAPTPPGC